MKRVNLLTLWSFILVPAALAGDFPAGETDIIELESTVASSAFGTSILPPLKSAFDRAGLRHDPGPGAHYVATLRSLYDTGRWNAWFMRRSG